jgi:dTDP-4-amino-4,6-dideoxygalactose transaminase
MEQNMSDLGMLGGESVRKEPFPLWPEIDERDRCELEKVLVSGNWWMYAYSADELASFSKGRSRVEIFEEEFGKMHNAKYSIAVTSGSSALDICCRAIGLKPGDEVITTPYTFFATSECILNVGAVPVYVDIDPTTYAMNVELIEAAITERTRAIIPVHFGSCLCDMDRIMEIAHKYNLKVIEDAAHVPGASIKTGRFAGTLGHIGIFSFQQSKILTSGEGGIITTNDPVLGELAWSLRHYGRLKEGLWYEHFRLGWNARLTEFQGSVLLTQFEKIPEQHSRRSKNALRLLEELEEIPGITTMKSHKDKEKETFYLICLRYNKSEWDNLPREKLLNALLAEGIPCSSGYTFPLYANPIFQSLDEGNFEGIPLLESKFLFRKFYNYKNHCPVVEKACTEESVWLTQNVLLGTEDDVMDVIKAFKKVYENRKQLLCKSNY